jgi:hypothetical protein
MNKHITVFSFISLVALGAGGCQSHDRAQPHPSAPVTELTYTKQVSANQLPADVIKAVHQHVLQPQIINAETVMCRGAMAYKVYVLSGNTVYILDIRPSGYYLDMNVDTD